MVIFLYGADSFRKNQKLKEIITDYKKKHSSFAIEKFYLQDKDVLFSLNDFVKAISLFDNMKLGVIEHKTLASKKEEKEYINILKENIKSKDVVLIVLSERKPTKTFSFLLKAPVFFQEFDTLKGSLFIDFLKKEASKKGIEFDQESRDLLASVYEGNTWGLITELDKLALLNTKKITKRVLEKYVDVSIPIDIFRTLGEITSAYNIGEKLTLLEELFKRSGDSAMIFNFLTTFSRSRGEKKMMADYDVAIKKGKLEYEEALVDYMLR
ncbi:hypothetical protein GW950_00735 [Candidatus Wolfebacteria bacterium]|nr:hypothetical protein [Candidatus Wolfebacteria bacterium]